MNDRSHFRSIFIEGIDSWLQAALKSVHHRFTPKFMLDYDIKCNHW